MSDTLTKKQTQVLTLAKTHDGDVRKIAKKMKITPNGVYGHIKRIREKGHYVPGHGNGSDEGAGNGKVVAPTIESVVKDVTARVDAEIEKAEKALRQAEHDEAQADTALAEATQQAEDAQKLRLQRSDELGDLKHYRATVSG
jgi:hypothetical protein